jgi:hypothetical protein
MTARRCGWLAGPRLDRGGFCGKLIVGFDQWFGIEPYDPRIGTNVSSHIDVRQPVILLRLDGIDYIQVQM